MNLLDKAIEALRPFAAMHREGCDPNEVACKRGTASDMTMLTSSDFQRASKVLAKYEKAKTNEPTKNRTKKRSQTRS